ncbi:MAG: NAD(P)H-dependent glycerol-3-phosphate dehydrogenase [Bacteroidota bacterium]
MMNKNKIAVIGAGSWGTALTKILLNNIPEVHWWIREVEVIENLRTYYHNPLYLSAVEFDKGQLNVHEKIEDAVKNADILFFAVPSAFLEDVCSSLPSDFFKGKKIVSAIKGIIPGANLIVGEYFHRTFNVPFENFAVIGGPSHAEEVALEKLTYLTIASQNPQLAIEVSQLLECRYIRTSQTDDIYGSEYATVLKNIYAIAAGIARGLGYGDNYVAVLISNALSEMRRFIETISPVKPDLFASIYLGDLMVTAYSQFSRNRTFGQMLGNGYSVKSAQLEMNMIAEGYYGAKCIHEIIQEKQLDMPVAEAIYGVLYEKIAPMIEFRILSSKLS